MRHTHRSQPIPGAFAALRLCVLCTCLLGAPLFSASADTVTDSSVQSTSEIAAPDSAAAPTDSAAGPLPPAAAVPQNAEGGVRSVLPKSAVKDTVDSVAAALTARQWYAGIGWSLGSFDLYSLWQKSLPDSLSDFGLPRKILGSDFGFAQSDSDSVALAFRVRERPDAYNVHFPVYLSFSPPARTGRRISIETSFLFARKAFLGSVDVDSLHYRLDTKQSLLFLCGGLGITCSQALPPDYFRITGVDATYVTVGLAAQPLSLLVRNTTLTAVEEVPDSLHAFDVHVRESVENVLPETRAFGVGLSWRAGLSTASVVRSGRTLRAGLCYSGRWFRSFRRDGATVTYRDIERRSSSSLDPLSFALHQIEIQVGLAGGRTRKPPETP